MSWAPSETGLKLTAFQVRFALNALPWAREAFPTDVVAAYDRLNKPHLLVRSMYNSLGGRPTSEMLSRFQVEAKRIEAMSSFEQFFDMVDMSCGRMEIQVMLCDAMLSSVKSGYHRAYG